MKHLILILLVITSCMVVKAQQYDFPVKPGSAGWKRLATHEEMLSVTQLPDYYLKEASTTDLLQTCLHYPLLFDMLAYDNLSFGFQEMSKKFNGFQELKIRKDAAKVILQEYKKIRPEDVSKINEEVEKGRMSFLVSTIELLIVTKPILSQMDEDEKMDLLSELYIKDQSKRMYKKFLAG